MNDQKIHKAKLWQLPLYACNQIGMNLYFWGSGPDSRNALVVGAAGRLSGQAPQIFQRRMVGNE